MFFEVIDVPQNEPCENCIPCMRLKLMEFGFIAGQDIEIQKKTMGVICYQYDFKARAC